MRDPTFREFEEYLRRSGVSPHYVNRAIEELQDHYADLVEEARASGKDIQQSRQEAQERLGCLGSIAEEILSHPEVMSWGHRHPLMSSGAQLLGEAIEIPAIPLMLCVANCRMIFRWVAAFCVGSGAALALLYLLQLLIGIG